MAGKRVALVIGNAKYTYAGTLADPVNDASGQAPLSEGALAWAEVKDSKDVAVLEAFRRQFGAGNPIWDLLATRRIAELTEAPQCSSRPFGQGQKAGPDAAKAPEQQTAVVVPKPAPALQPEPVCDGLLVSVATGDKPCIKPGSGAVFKDCADCPEMTIVPEGRFIMGSPETEPERQSDETQHEVRFAKPFAVGRFAVTFAEWDACVADGGCGGYRPRGEGWGRDGRPVINVNWNHAKSYVQWLSKKTGRQYRLLSEAEREYAARAGTVTPFWWGASITPDQANYCGTCDPYKGGGQKGVYCSKTLPVNSFKPNPWGLYQVHGNIWEWVEDCWHDSYDGAPSDGTAWTTGKCTYRVLRGGSWFHPPQHLRAAYRDYHAHDAPSDYIGFRVGLGWLDLNR